MPTKSKSNKVKRTSNINKPDNKNVKMIKPWHLAITPDEDKIVQFEAGLLRLIRDFNRFAEIATTSLSGILISAAEINLLHILRMHDTPKSAAILANLLNRDDHSNIQYGLKKLRELKLIRKHKMSTKKVFYYEVTEKGVEVTDEYAALKREIVNNTIYSISEWEDRIENATEFMRLFTGIFHEAAHVAATHPTNDE